MSVLSRLLLLPPGACEVGVICEVGGICEVGVACVFCEGRVSLL